MPFVLEQCIDLSALESSRLLRRVAEALQLAKVGLATAALRLESGAQVLDLGSGSGEMLCTWARDHGASAPAST